MYEVTTDDQSQQQVDALPAEGLAAFAEARSMLEVAPWNGAPYHKHKPDSPMRAVTFGPAGQGDLVYLILDEFRRVDILVIIWLDVGAEQVIHVMRPGHIHASAH